jgi:hypothetical protein
MSNGTLRFSTFFDKICPFFHKNDPDPHQKSPKTNILQIRSKKHQNRPTQKHPPPARRPILMFFGPNLQNILCFWRFLTWSPARSDEKNGQIFVQKSRKSESTIAHCYLLTELFSKISYQVTSIDRVQQLQHQLQHHNNIDEVSYRSGFTAWEVY